MSDFGELQQVDAGVLNVGYAEIPRHLTEGASTPFLGFGGNVLMLPAGFPAVDTASMPLASRLGRRALNAIS
mgnify:CR=1 FL=1